jgi:DNA-binding beta-propeller fold protein YncE
MARLFALALAAFTCILLPHTGLAAIGAAPLVLERAIPLGHVAGRIDHMAIDLPRKRLIMAELGNDTVGVIDLGSGKLLHRFGGLKEPQGVAYIPGSDLIVVANAGDGSVDFYDGSDFSSRGVLRLEGDADNMRVDPRTEQVVVGYGNGGLAVIDASRRAKVRSIELPGHPESFQLDPRSNRAYVNIPDAAQIAVVDLAAGRQSAKWTVPDLAENFPMAIDESGGTIATVFRSPPRLVILNGSTGAVSGSYPTCADADDVFFDPQRDRIYVSCGAGAVDVFSLLPGVQHTARVPTSAGARTSLFVPKLDRLYVASRAGLFGSDAAILVFRPY